MRQSQTYRRKKSGEMNIDPNNINTFRSAVAYRIMRKSRRGMSMMDAWQLAAVPSFILWLFRGPYYFFKKKDADRKMRRKLARSNRNTRSTE